MMITVPAQTFKVVLSAKKRNPASADKGVCKYSKGEITVIFPTWYARMTQYCASVAVAAMTKRHPKVFKSVPYGT